MTRIPASAASAAALPTSQLMQQMKALGKKNVQDMFRQMDTDGNGTIDRDEFQRGLAAQGMDPTHVTALFRHLDPHRTGVVNYKTFFDTYYDQLPLPPSLLSNAQVLEKVQRTLHAKRHRLHKLFHGFDQDKNGTIDHREFHQCLTSLGLQPAEIDVALDVFDPDGNGAIDYAEFTAAVLPLDGATELHALNLAMEKPHGVKAFPPAPSLVKPLIELAHDEADDDGSVAELYATFLEKLLLKHRDLRSAFRLFDVKKEGQLTRTAFDKCVESIFGDAAADAAARLWAHVDPTHTGFVPFHAFSKAKQPPVGHVSPPKPSRLNPILPSPARAPTRRSMVQEKVRLYLERKFSHVGKGVGELYRLCRPDAVGVFDKRNLLRVLQSHCQLSADDAALFCSFGRPSSDMNMMEKDILSCLHMTSTPPEVDSNPRDVLKDAQRIVHLADTHSRTFQQLFRQVVQDTPQNKVVHTKLSLPRLSDVIYDTFQVDIPPERLEDLLGDSNDVTYSQLVHCAERKVMAIEAPDAIATLAKTDFYGQPLGNRASEPPSPLAKRHVSDPAFLTHDMRIQELPSPTKRALPRQLSAHALDFPGAGVPSAALGGVRCTVEPIVAQPEPDERRVAPRWQVKTVEIAHEKIGLGGGRKKMADEPGRHDMNELIWSPPPQAPSPSPTRRGGTTRLW